MSALTDARLDRARQLLQAGRDELARAEESKGQAAAIGLQNSCGKGWLAVLEAIYAYLLSRGIEESELPNNERGRQYFVQNYLNRDLRKSYKSFRTTFHTDGYYEAIVSFDDMPENFDELAEFIATIQSHIRNGEGV